MSDIEPQTTLRGHSASITRIVVSSKGIVFSASLDSTIRTWAVPPTSHITYSAFDISLVKNILVGHTDAVWDLALLRDDTVLVSVGAEGAAKVWDVSSGNGSGALRLTWGYTGVGGSGTAGDGVGATSVEGIKTDWKKIAVAYTDAIVKIFELETGAEVGRLQSDSTYGMLVLSPEFD